VVKEAPIGISRRISEIYAKPADAIDKSDLKYLADAIKRYGGVEYMKRRMKMELHIARKLWHSYNVFPSNKFSKMLEAMIDSDMLEEYTRE
ncbi:MAG: hypothetical protein M1528_00070, partial [Candidatus Marsarchaeota archaeon]|nr:hypothetical protein [Candidatus Marsarchaeota archaeon]